MVSRANTSPVNIGAGAFIAAGVIAAGGALQGDPPHYRKR